MLGDISNVDHIYIRPGYTDMRKQLDGLFVGQNYGAGQIK